MNSSVEKPKRPQLANPPPNDPVYESNEGESISNLPNPVGDNSSKPLFHSEQPPHQEYSERKMEQSATDSNSNNIFITEKPGEGDGFDNEEEDEPEDEKEDGKEGEEGQELVPYQEQEEVDIIYSEEEILSFRNIFDMFDKEKTG